MKLTSAAVSSETIEDLIAASRMQLMQMMRGTNFGLRVISSRLLGYAKWDNFLTVDQRARDACEASGHATADHFADVGKKISLGKVAERESRISPSAVRKLPRCSKWRRLMQEWTCATHFAIRQGAGNCRPADRRIRPLSEDERRCLLRDEIKEHNKNLRQRGKKCRRS